MYTNIEIGNMDEKQAGIVKAKIHGMTYMDFQVVCAPIGGEYHVSVDINYNGSEEEIMGMLLFVMATNL